MIFKRNKKYLFYTISVSHLLMFFIGIGGNLTTTNFLPLWIITVVLPNLIIITLKSLRSIDVRDEYMILMFSKHFKSYIESYKYDDLLFTYKEEIEGKSWGTRFRIYKKGSEKSITSVGGVVDGWPEEEIEKIITELKSKGIDVKIN
jgi:hypothetical protein